MLNAFIDVECVFQATAGTPGIPGAPGFKGEPVS